MKFIKSLTIAAKLNTLTAVLGLLICVLIATSVKEKWAEAESSEHVFDACGLMVHTNAVVHECQKERGTTGLFLNNSGDKSEQFAASMHAQRQMTDKKIAELEAYVKDIQLKRISPAFATQYATAKSQLDKLHETRRAIDNRSLSGGQALSYYTGMNAEFLRLTDQLGELAIDPETTANVTAFSAFLQAKERGGIERAVLAMSFAKDEFQDGAFEKFITLVAAQKTYLAVFENQFSEDGLAFYKRTMDHEAVREVNTLRQTAIDKAGSGNFDISPQYWFKTITTKINLMKDVEDHLIDIIYQDAEACYKDSRSIALLTGASLLVVVLLVLGGFLVSRSITGSIGSVVDRLKDISEGNGDLTVRLDVSGNDEMAMLSRNFNRFIEKLESIMSEIGSNTSTLASTSEQLFSNAETMETSAATMNSQSTSAAAAVEQLSSNLTNIAAGAEEMSTTVTTVATAIEEMSASLSEVARNCADGSVMSAQADSEARAAGETMSALNASAEEIGRVVDTISDIADQTNLLALNATIEAASAGDAGKGFAVVANEVKELARQTAQATEEIGRLIGEMQSKTGDAVQATGAISNLINQLNGTVQTIASAVEQQSATTDEVARNICSASQAATGISSNIQSASAGSAEVSENVSRLAGESGTVKSGASQTNTGSGELSKMAARLNSLVGQFRLNGSEAVLAPKPVFQD